MKGKMQNRISLMKIISPNIRKLRSYKSSADVRQEKSIDLRSDTMTKPSKDMLNSMVNSKVGDDVFKEDPTVNQLEARCAALFGMENALFVPTGTMGNLLCVMSHCTGRGEELIIGSNQHVYIYEQGHFMQLASIPACVIPNQPDGTMLISDIEKSIKDNSDFHQCESKLICLENTHMKKGGLPLPLTFLHDVTNLAENHNLKVHVDGARLYNAAVSQKLPVSRLLEGIDSVSMCLSKGLGCPIGSIIGGTNEFIQRAKRLRKPLGGGMRQSGILAGAGLYALDHAEETLQSDHIKVKTLAKQIKSLNNEKLGVNLDNVQTNILFIHTPKGMAQELVDKLAIYDVLCIAFDDSTVRMVTHLDVSHDDITKVLECFRILNF